MKRIVGSVFFGLTSLLPFFVLAALPIINDPLRPYDPLPVDASIEVEQLYLGELIGDPHMFEVTIGEEKVFSMKLLQEDKATTTMFSFILVKDNGNNRGVSEVGRQNGREIDWVAYRDANFAMRFKKGMEYMATLAPGVYRFEVSTPDNQGKYLLILGQESAEEGYLTEFGQIRAVQAFFGYSSFRLFLSSYVLYPLGSAMIIALFFYTWRMSRSRSKVEIKNENV